METQWLKSVLFALVFLSLDSRAYSTWVTELSDLSLGLQLPVYEDKKKIRPQRKNLIARIRHSNQEKNTIERPSVRIAHDRDRIFDIVNEIGKAGKKLRLYKYLRRNFEANGEWIRVSVRPSLLPLINIDRFIERFYTFPHYDVIVDTQLLRKQPATVAELSTQLAWFLGADNVAKVEQRIASGLNIDVERWLLPAFARRAARSFNRNRGPNCFHSAVSFQDESIPENDRLNVKREKHHHHTMINFDELWRILHKGMYVISPSETDLKYGDVIVFFDLPEDYHFGGGIDYRWIKHATVYLFNEYTFSKGSKSANTPYTVNLLREEWTKWRNYTKNLAVRIYRKAQVQVRSLPREDRLDWLY